MTEARKRLMQPVAEDPQVLIVGGPVDGFTFYDAGPGDDWPDHYREARTLALEGSQQDWWMQKLHDLSEIAPVDDDDRPPACPIEAKRAEFLRKMAELRALREAKRGGGVRDIILTDEVLALAEELLA